jgi:hypothetical protein
MKLLYDFQLGAITGLELVFLLEEILELAKKEMNNG